MSIHQHSILQKTYMHKQFQRVFFFSLVIAALIFIVSSCKKQDKYPGQTLPKITSVNPSSAIPGTHVKIKGVNLKNVSDVKFGTTDAVVDAASITDTAINTIVPDSLPPGDLYVQVYVGDGKAYAAIKFTVLEAPKIPTITSIKPDTAFPGDNVVITGINFMNVSSVTFGSLSANYVIGDSTKLTVTVPPNISGVKQVITVSAPSGSDTVSFVVNYAPVITSFSPGQAKEGDVDTVTGKRFTGTTSVKLGALSASFTVINDTTLTFTVPPGASSGNIIITTPNGTATSSSPLSILAAGLAFPIYDEGVTSNWTNSGWIGGGWGGTVNYKNTSPVETGTYSAEIDYVGAYGSPLQLGGASINLSPYTSFKVSVYGGANSNGKQINIGLNQKDGYTITVVEGKWTDYQIPISSLTTSSTLTDIWIKEYSGTGGFTIYIDNMGLN